MAIDAAIEDGVDVLNLSVGHGGGQIPIHADPFYRPTMRAIDAGIIPVAAAGNAQTERGPRDNEYVYSPALIPEVIAVAGMEVICPEGMEYSTQERKEGPFHFEGDRRERTFCSQQTTCNEGQCLLKAEERYWMGNVNPIDGKPDLAAPCIHPIFMDNIDICEVGYDLGTSFAAPLVAGTIAIILSELDVPTDAVQPEIKSILVDTAQPFSGDASPAPKLNGYQALKEAHQRLDGPNPTQT
ncbi:hypothetical protein HBNXHx_1715 [Haloferax volcanii]|nr:hypothetical protein HBNXHx_1715 [Haloferax alexandrinus]